MVMHDFKDLSNFIYDEYQKMFESLGIEKVPKNASRFIFKSLKQYMKLYKKPLFLRAKLSLKVEIAIETLAYKSKLWKFFHPTLYKIVLFELEKEPEEPEEEPKIINNLPAVIVQSRDISPISHIEEDGFAPF